MQNYSNLDLKTNPFEQIFNQGTGNTPPLSIPQGQGGQPIPTEMTAPMGAEATVPMGVESTTPMGAETTVPMTAEQPTPQGAGQAIPQGQEEMVDQLTKGQNQTRSRHLAKAIDALEKYIDDSSSREDVMLARGLLSALARLMSKDQRELGMEASGSGAETLA